MNIISTNEMFLNFKFTDIDPVGNTVEDLMLRICHYENVGNSTGVCLYTVDGMPLTDDPFFNTCKLTQCQGFKINNDRAFFSVMFSEGISGLYTNDKTFEV